MKLNAQLIGLEKLQKQLQALSGPQVRAAHAKALNDGAYQVRRAMQADLAQVFDRPTPFILKSVQVKQATSEHLVATIEPTYYGAKGNDPQQILRAQEDGGTRRDKRSEIALRRAGILPAGYQTAIPSQPYPDSDDGRGNVRGPFLVKLISYFQAFGEQGYRGNMTDKRKTGLAKRGTTAGGYASIGGVVFFASFGTLRGGPSAHLAPGIWAKTGTHGSNVRPVLMFVKTPTYTPRIDAKRIAKNADLATYLPKRMRFRIRQAYEQLGGV